MVPAAGMELGESHAHSDQGTVESELIPRPGAHKHTHTSMCLYSVCPTIVVTHLPQRERALQRGFQSAGFHFQHRWERKELTMLSMNAVQVQHCENVVGLFIFWNRL